jgi:hypothetical protein
LEIKIDAFDFETLRIVDTNGQLEVFNLREELKVNEQNLQKEMLEQPGKYIYWSSLLEKLKYYQESKELEIEQREAELEPTARTELKKEEAKPTKDMIASYIKRDGQYQKLQNELLTYNFIIGKIGRIVKAFEQRKDMLQSYGKQVAHDQQYGGGAGKYAQNPFV